jgi:CYTH domain-containing protein
MINEIERKFLISKMPDLSNLKSVIYERYYIYRDENVEMRVQKKGNKFELERKVVINKLKAIKTKTEISKPEFEKLKTICSKEILREGYFLNSSLNISIKIYHGKHEGLSRVEVEFNSEDDAKAFQIPDWFGKEITDSILSRDSKLLDLDENEIKNFLEDITKTK